MAENWHDPELDAHALASEFVLELGHEFTGDEPPDGPGESPGERLEHRFGPDASRWAEKLRLAA